MKHRIGANGTSVKGKKGAGIFFTDGSSVLLLKRSEAGDNAGTWGIPGGSAKDGESQIGTAIREAKEETGLDAIPGYRFIESKNGRHLFTVFFYKANPFDVQLSEEHDDWKWVSFQDLKNCNLHPKLQSHLTQYLSIIRHKSSSFSEWSNITDSLKNFLPIR